MVQELQHQSVPEEFFNLTQLAEVTLIAGKLSTTDINEIRNYISKSEEDCHGSEMTTTENSHSHILTHHNEKCLNVVGYESTKKKWKNHWENFKEQEIHSPPPQYEIAARIENSPSSSSVKTYAFLSSSCSSVSSDCDDDSTKSLLSYSHKVFDRKKQRSFKQSSTESEYEFHFECQRPPYSISGESNIASQCDNHNKDYSMTTTADGALKIDLAENDMSSDEIKSEDPNASDGNFEMKNDDHHMCPECGKRYSTSELTNAMTNL
jgi:hypothetical protein